MKRLAWLVVVGLLFGLTTGVFAYDGPPPLLYNQTVGTVQVQATIQSKAFYGGRTKFTMSAHVPITADHVGKTVLMQMRRYEPIDGDLVSYSCTFVPTLADVGTTVVYNCDGFEVIPGTTPLTPSVEVYPYVMVNSSVVGTELEHNGQPFRVTIPYVGDDAYEPNNNALVATNLGTVAGTTTFTELIWRNQDYFKFVAGPGTGSAEITIQFWTQAADLDIYITNTLGELLALSASSTDDEERVNFAVTPGVTYYVDIEAYDPAPAFYDMSVKVAPPDTLTVTSGPGGAPNPVVANNSANLSVTVNDSLGHPLSYLWFALCPTLSTAGSWSSRYVQNPVWTSPANSTGMQQNCSITVQVSDGAGVSLQASYVQKVDPLVHSLSITAGPSGTPNPVGSQGGVTLSVTALDTLTHALAYTWHAACSGLPSNGTFTPSAGVQAPTWTAPQNITGLQKNCTITAFVDDGKGLTASNAYAQTVNSVADSVTITAGPTGTPNPVASSGSVALSVGASDPIGHALSYAWQATCAGLGSNGSFANGTTATPTWTPPANNTGSQQSCTIAVIASDGFGNSANAQHTQRVSSIPDTVTITAGPSGTPNPVASAGAVTLSVTASDSIGHGLSYAWQATCPGIGASGSFTNATSAAPIWTAPLNATGTQQACTITVTANDGLGHTASNGYSQLVSAGVDTVTITAGPTSTPNPVASGAAVSLSVVAIDSLTHALSYAWTATCPGLGGNGTFNNGATATPSWTAPMNLTGTQQSCTLGVTASDGLGHSASGSVPLLVNSVNHTVTITAGPSGTPNPVASGATAALSVAAGDSLGHALTYAWSAACPGAAGSGTFAPNNAAAQPTWHAPANPTAAPITCQIALLVSDGQGQTAAGSYAHVVDAQSHTLTLTQLPSGTPNPVTSGGLVTLSATAVDSLGHPVGYQWSASCPLTLGGNGSFSNAAVQSPTWTAPANATGADQVCAISVTTGDQNGKSAGANVNQTVLAAPTEPTTEFRYYFAEGATIAGFFETRFALLNADPTQAAEVALDFQLKDTTTVVTHTLTVAAHSRATIDVATLAAQHAALAALASAEFSTVVRANRPLVADRTMTWGNGYGSHAETAILAPAPTWYLAEGATLGAFELYYLIQNPNNVPLAFTVTYLLPPPAQPLVRTYTVGANTRTNIAVHHEPGLADVEVSAVIAAPADTPIIVERAMYLTTGDLVYGAGHESAGIRAPATQWFFAEGATGAFFDLFILIANPDTTAAAVTATFLFDDGTTCGLAVPVGAQSRYNIWVDTLEIPGCPRSLADAAVSTTITADRPVIAERAMWWPGPTPTTWAEAHNAAGATETGVAWGLADGEQGGLRSSETYFLIANTSPYAGSARVTLYLENGATLQKTVTLAGNSRTNVPVGASIEAGGFGAPVSGQRFGAVVESQPVVNQPGPARIVVERAMYAHGAGAPFWAAGTDALATKLR